MNFHAHITLCDDKWNLFYDYIDFDTQASVTKFLDLIFEVFNPEKIPREQVESYMYTYVDDKVTSPLYFKTGDLIYLWVLCTGCNAFSLN